VWNAKHQYARCAFERSEVSAQLDEPAKCFKLRPQNLACSDPVLKDTISRRLLASTLNDAAAKPLNISQQRTGGQCSLSQLVLLLRFGISRGDVFRFVVLIFIECFFIRNALETLKVFCQLTNAVLRAWT